MRLDLSLEQTFSHRVKKLETIGKAPIRGLESCWLLASFQIPLAFAF